MQTGNRLYSKSCQGTIWQTKHGCGYTYRKFDWKMSHDDQLLLLVLRLITISYFYHNNIRRDWYFWGEGGSDIPELPLLQ